MNEREMLIRAGDILEICKGCPNVIKVSSIVAQVEKACDGCNLYKELRGIGEALSVNDITHKPKLGRKSKYTVPFTKEEYIQMKKDGIGDPKICARYAIELKAFNSWKRSNNITVIEYKTLKKNMK